MSLHEKRERMVRHPLNLAYLSKEEVVRAMRTVPRHILVPSYLQHEDCEDHPLRKTS